MKKERTMIMDNFGELFIKIYPDSAMLIMNEVLDFNE